jgi:hypothetical protein
MRANSLLWIAGEKGDANFLAWNIGPDIPLKYPGKRIYGPGSSGRRRMGPH